ncbi:hypothetical protein MTR67_020341 [Solanum verrucosum]|uniref:Reverse transcriptase domain-containing protein n=1 Tax=Solanum verrucosum TaxID=315347 RepID=A0AAF0QPB0_SOLVR|nr:hypothetical protein MTR67_020341 [Solanum verrucosum]
MYDGAKTQVRMVGGDSEHFSVEVGVISGPVLSPFLFFLMMDELTRSFQDEVPWYMLFANDIILIDEIRDIVTDRLEVWIYILVEGASTPNKEARKAYCGGTRKTMGRSKKYWRELSHSSPEGSDPIAVKLPRPYLSFA